MSILESKKRPNLFGFSDVAKAFGLTYRQWRFLLESRGVPTFKVAGRRFVDRQGFAKIGKILADRGGRWGRRS